MPPEVCLKNGTGQLGCLLSALDIFLSMLGLELAVGIAVHCARIDMQRRLDCVFQTFQRGDINLWLFPFGLPLTGLSRFNGFRVSCAPRIRFALCLWALGALSWCCLRGFVRRKAFLAPLGFPDHFPLFRKNSNLWAFKHRLHSVREGRDAGAILIPLGCA